MRERKREETCGEERETWGEGGGERESVCENYKGDFLGYEELVLFY